METHTTEIQSIDKQAAVKQSIEKNQMLDKLKDAGSSSSSSSSSSTGAGSAQPGFGRTASGDTCHTMPNTELWGDVVVSGSMLKKDSPGECCEACKAVKPNGPDDLDCNGALRCALRRACRGSRHCGALTGLMGPP
jgi:hypothetical protein